MDLIRNLNIRKSELIQTVYDLAGDEKTKLQLKIVYVRSNGTWKFLIGTCKPCAAKAEEACAQYNNYAFFCKNIAQDSYASFLQKVYDDGYEIGEEFPKIKFEEKTNWNQEKIIPSHQTANKFPARQFSAQIEKDVHFQETKLIGFNQDFYPSARKYIETFIDLEIFHGDQDARKGNMLIEVADYRGRIEINQGILKIHAKTDNFCIVGQSALHKQIKLEGNSTYPLGQIDMEDLELWMLKKDGEVIDFRSASEHTNRKDKFETADNYMSIIHRGESEHTEFKPYITINKNDKSKIDELEKTVCALSNHEGGQIFIGVNDNLDVIGFYDKTFRRDYPGAPEETALLYINDIRKFLRESLRHNQCFEIENVSISTKPIIIILVQKINSINFTVRDGQAYIRKGASNAKMSPEEIQLRTRDTDSMRRSGTFF